MNKILLALVGLGAIFVIGYLVIDTSDDTSEPTNDQQVVTQQDQTSQTLPVNDSSSEGTQQQVQAEPEDEATESTTSSDSSSELPGRYIDYLASELAASDDVNLLFFHADWCPQCRALENDIRAQGVPSGITIFEVDFDNSSELRQRYGVTQQTTIVRVDSDGNQVSKYGAYSTPNLDAVLANIL